jgi:uncharacterized phage protein (TIGR02216 family)
MEMGLGRLARSPKEFWAMTPKELEAAIAGAVGLAPASLSRACARRTDVALSRSGT